MRCIARRHRAQTAPGSNGKFQREHRLEFPILDDGRGDVAVAYHIRWSPEELAAEERLGKLPGLNIETTWILPMQARYVIGRDDVIAYADINADYRRRSAGNLPASGERSDSGAAREPDTSSAPPAATVVQAPTLGAHAPQAEGQPSWMEGMTPELGHASAQADVRRKAGRS